MDVSRLEAGRLKGSFKLCNLGVMTRDLAALFRGAIERAKLRFVVECDMSNMNTFIDPEHWVRTARSPVGLPDEAKATGKNHVQLDRQCAKVYHERVGDRCQSQRQVGKTQN